MNERVMDSNAIERERGITILAKNAALTYQGTHINIVDTPGHADFGGEVERVLGMVDGVLLLVDAVEGPMPQTRFVTKKALQLGLNPIVVVNKIDRHGARINWVVEKTFELFIHLDASEEQLDFPIVYTSALQGYATLDFKSPSDSMQVLFEAILSHVPAPQGDSHQPLQLQIAALDYSSYTGLLGIGRIKNGQMQANQAVVVMSKDDKVAEGRIQQILGFDGLARIPLTQAQAGDIVVISGIDQLQIGYTLCHPDHLMGLPLLQVDEPTLVMDFMVNTSPLAGMDGKLITSRQIRERLHKELMTNVALQVEDTADSDVFRVSGRGELHLTILLENMRREGYELAVGKPRVLFRQIDDVLCEPYELLTVDVDNTHQGVVMSELGWRRGELQHMAADEHGRTRLEYLIPARGLIGFQNEFLTLTRGTGVMSHVFEKYAPTKTDLPSRRNGVLISSEQGEAIAYALWKLQERGRMIVSPGDKLYEGMIVGIHNRDNDLVVNPTKTKQLTNVRASGHDEAIRLTPPSLLTLELAVEFIAEDELVEITPRTIRLRKRYLLEHERKRMLKTSVGD